MKKQLASFAFSSLVASITGCGDNTEPPPDADNTDDQTAPQFPASCMDAGNGKPVPDGVYTLYVQGDETKPWKAYCHQMNEYVAVDSDTNYGELAAGGTAVGSSVRTSYSRLRIDPETLVIDVSDQTFATSQGYINIGATEVTSMPLGIAMACDGANGYATTTIDLTRTPFAIDTSYLLGGTPVGGSHALFRDGRWFEAWVQGSCGFAAPAGVQDMPVNQLADGFVLKVELVGPEQI